ncbi:MAG: UDP-3-O-acyl-N-acetylglucosamine deacetylase [Prevotella sp.]|jgi:UDP-3-O-[3-hydroxymyristoyl] N-acetylglucosamine deacetylase/3-hydroxyacyl-[acyl-carrier-protein] dehydratase|nr:UDP-3-O-acyl-N-acetylglucosamine deacetylase [Prevotella sp.]
MKKQVTLRGSFYLEGIGLHTRVKSRITFHPAPENFGYKIKRTDISGQPIIDALAENVVETERGTALEVNNVRVGTKEHALAALYACGIDNCLIEIDASEFPILDGSSILYIKAIKETGIQKQATERKYIYFPRKKIKVVDKDTNSSLLLIPSETFSVECNISFDSALLKRQSARLDHFSDFPKEIASARTFVFVKEIRYLIQKNLIKGGDLNNAIVIYDDILPQDEYDKLADIMKVVHKDASQKGYIMNKPFIYTNEPARHKLLDVIGDLALVGGFIKGKILANRPGHKINTRFAKAIREYSIAETEKKIQKRKLKKESLNPISGFYWHCPEL